MKALLSFSALFLSVALLQLSSGALGPLDALSGLARGFSTTEVGLLGSAHFVGFFAGCWWAPRLLGSVGHSRAFSVFTALGAIGVLGHLLWVEPRAWAVMRLASGLCIAGSYTVIEAWMNDRVTNATRGRIMGSYRIVDLAASLAAQLMIGVLEPGHYLSYTIVAMLCCAALLPLALTRTAQPATPRAPRLRPGLAWQLSPLGLTGVVVAGLTSASFRMVGPIYGIRVGLSADQIALFLAIFVAGGALSQLPIGWLADRHDRRRVLIWISAGAIGACGLTSLAPQAGIAGVMAAGGLFGFATFPVFSVATAHAHDFARAEERVELSAALMFWYATGAIAAPLAVSSLIERFGPPALFVFVAAGHLGLVLFGLARMRARPPSEARTNYVYAPRTTLTMGRLWSRLRDRAR